MWPFRRQPRPIRFTYKKYRDTLAPIIPIRVLSGKRWRRIWAYVDSGAAYSILTVADAKKLGLMKVKARHLAVTTSGGRSEKISLHRLWVKLNDKRQSVTFGVPRGFDLDFNLLGRRDLFKKYVVCIDDANGVITFTPHHR